MSILQFTGLPKEYKGLKLLTDFRNMINVDTLVNDDSLSSSARNLLLLQQLYPAIPADIGMALEGLLWFFSRGENAGEGKQEGTERPKRSFDFEQDADHIYASFCAAYGIRLASIKHMHWWEFLALFHGLPEDTIMKRIMYYRTVDINKVSKHEKKHVQEMKRAYALKSKRAKELEHMTIEDLNRKTQEYYDRRTKMRGGG